MEGQWKTNESEKTNDIIKSQESRSPPPAAMKGQLFLGLQFDTLD